MIEIADINCNGRDALSQEHIDAIYSLVNGFNKISSDKRSAFLSTMTELCSKMLTASTAEDINIAGKNSIKMIQFFMLQVAVKGEAGAKSAAIAATSSLSSNSAPLDDFDDENRAPVAVAPKKGKASKASTTKKGKGGSDSSSSFDWCRWRVSSLELLERCLAPECLSIWSMGIVAENFLSGVWKYALQLLEDKPVGVGGSGAAEVSVRDLCIQLIVKCVKLFGSAKSTGSYNALSSALIDSLTKHEHMSMYIADMAALSSSSGVAGKLLISELMTDIANMNMATVPSVKNIGLFIELFAKQSPALMASYLPIVKPQIDSAAHQIRFQKNTIMSFLPLHIIFLFKS